MALRDTLRRFGLIGPVRRTGPKRRRPGGGSATEPAPVKPDRPNNLTGGAAAALEFEG